MKKRAMAAVVMLALAFGLWGCGSPADPAEEAAAYTEQVQPILEDISADFQAEFAALQADDVDECTDLCAKVTASCDKIIDMDNVPEVASKAHAKQIEYAEHVKEAALDYATAATLKAVDVKAAAMSLEDAAEETDKATQAAKEATAAIQEMRDSVKGS